MPARSRYNIYGTLQGTYKPTALNQSGERKYQGRHDPTYRSSYERQCFYLLEQNPGVRWWRSEATVIPYISPIDRRRHSYYMDLTFEAIDKKTGLPQIYMIEVKPNSQTVAPVKTPRQHTKTYVTACKRWAVNVAKWNAAYDFAVNKGYKFYIWTELRMFEWKPLVVSENGA